MKKLPAGLVISGLPDLTLGDFWSWAYSDVLNNRNRSIFAEFLVASAFGVLDTPRVEWDAVDLRYRGKGIEVKSAAYLQSWQQEKLSEVRFGIAKKQGWDARANTYAPEPLRSANCYVFCLYPETDPNKVDVLDVNAWRFYVLATDQIERELGDQKSVGIKGIQAMCEPVNYDGLQTQIDLTLEMHRTNQARVQYPRLLQPKYAEPISLSSGSTVEIPKTTLVFNRWTGVPIADTYGGKPVLDFAGEPVFAELAVLRAFQTSGWSGAWVDTYRQKYRIGYWKESSEIALPPEQEAFLERIHGQVGMSKGCWDVFCWQGTRRMFVEVKQLGRDQIRDTQRRWLEAALCIGLPLESFLIVEWSMG